MPSPLLVGATDLDSWARQRDAQGRLPQLVRRLIQRTVTRIHRLSFRAGEGVQLGGWDGIAVVEEGNEFVPDGASVWEMGAGAKVQDKANKDYATRKADPLGVNPQETTFVFVTPRRWGGRGTWAEEKRQEGFWADVRAYDADSLEGWLERDSAVHIWLSGLLGKQPDGVSDLESFWEDWAAATRPPLPVGLALAGRDGLTSEVHTWLEGSAPLLALQAETRDEALGVFAATLDRLAPEAREDTFARCVLVRDPAAMPAVTAIGEGLIILLDPAEAEAIGRASRTGHRVVVPLGASDATYDTTLKAQRIDLAAATAVLTEAGVDESRAPELALLARRSLVSLRRRLALSPEVQAPQWARQETARALVPALLAGVWTEGPRSNDPQLIRQLAELPYEELQVTFVALASAPDPPLRCVGQTWFLVSQQDAWRLLGRFLTPADFDRFEEAALSLLSVPDTRLDLPEQERWTANLMDDRSRYSSQLRRGIAETIVVMGTLEAEVPFGGNLSASDRARRIVRQLLETAQEDWRTWATLAPILPILAEAAPREVMAAIEEGVKSAPPVLLSLFRDQSSGLLGSHSPHTWLLWALETIAWSPDHLARATLLLARLALIDPGGKTTSRPKNSLRDIFLPWRPHTSAAIDRRQRVLDTIREEEPEVAWELMTSLLPENHSHVFSTSKPRWRDWAPETRVPVTQGDYFREVEGIGFRMLEDVGDSGTRWADLIQALPRLPESVNVAVVEALGELTLDRRSTACRETWDALRSLISQHRSFPDAGWAMPGAKVDELAALLDRFEPDASPARYAWLFDWRPDLPEGRDGDFEEHQQAVKAAREETVASMFDADGLAVFLDLAPQVEQPVQLGATLGQLALVDEQAGMDFLSEHLAVPDDPRGHMARGFLLGCAASRGSEWIERIAVDPETRWTPEQRAEALTCLPVAPGTWGLAEGLGVDVEEAYWCRLGPYGVAGDDTEQAIRKFLWAGRAVTAAELTSHYSRGEVELPNTLIVEVLSGVLEAHPEDVRAWGSLHFEVPELLARIEESDDVPSSQVAQLEFAFLPLFRHHGEPRTLHRELGENPQFFVEVVEMVYVGEEEAPAELSEEDRARGEAAYGLLDSWRTVPGTDADGQVDAEKLSKWVDQAFTLLDESSRREIGETVIGQVLSGSPRDPDGAWPHSAVRDVIERVESSRLEEGIQTGKYNSRGVVTKHPTEGGDQERGIAETYRAWAEACADRWTRTTDLLMRMAEGYDREARSEDEEAELREDLGI